MDNHTVLYDTFRKQLANVHALTALTVSLFEIIVFLVLIRSGMEEFSRHSRYLWLCVVLPIAVNILTHTIVRILSNCPGISRKTKALLVLMATWITSLVVAVLHKEYIITSCAFVFPMILCAMFNERKLLTASFIVSLFILACVAVAFEVDNTANLVSRLNIFVLFGFAIVSYFCSAISINFSRESYATIQAQAERNDKLQDDVLRDQMTGLYNHKAFTDRLEQLIREYTPEASFCLTMMDIDDFKHINDQFGHDCGDEVLLFLAQQLEQISSQTHTPYRYGGEEFALISLGKDPDEVCCLIHRLLENFREQTFSFTDSSITFSAGVAAYTPGLTDEAFFGLADQTLYLAKKQGKNRVLKTRPQWAEQILRLLHYPQEDREAPVGND